MQKLFALQQCLEADYVLGKDYISDYFRPDLNSMEVQDKTLLDEQGKRAQLVFDSIMSGNSADETDSQIVKVAEQAVKSYHDRCRTDIAFFKKNLVSETENIYRHYLGVLSLGKQFYQLAKADKKVPQTNFINNSWLRALDECKELEKENYWGNLQSEVRSWYRDILRQDGDYLKYLDKKDPDYEEQKKFVNHFFRKIVLGKTNINGHFSEMILSWEEDRVIVKALVDKTVKSYNPNDKSPIQLHLLSLNWEEDRDFIEQLYEGVTKLSEEMKQLIASNTRNWEVERLPLTDRVILEMAIVELMTFPSIPVKVSINEYIELAKEYSTPNSRQFINGILDVISNELKSRGLVKKSGRGLMDNR